MISGVNLGTCFLTKTNHKNYKKNNKLEEDGEKRIFTKTQKEICWNNAPTIPGRDPARWRIDAVGNPVLSLLRGCHGALCHEYDHIVPFSKGGKTEVSNC